MSSVIATRFHCLYHIIFFILLIPPLPALSQKSPIEFQRYSLNEGLSQVTVFAILQDQRGYMWFGTADGLNKFDGYQFKSYHYVAFDSTSISDNRVMALLEDSAGRLWIGTLGGGLNRFDYASNTFINYRHDSDDPGTLSDDRVNSLYQDHEGVIWVGTVAGGLNRFDPETGRFTRYQHDPDDPGSLSDNHVFPISEDADGTLWIGTPSGLNRYEPSTDSFTRFIHNRRDQTSLSHDYVNTILVDHSGTLWIGTDHGLNRMRKVPARWAGDTENISFVRYYHDPRDPGTIGDNVIWSLYEDPEGYLWVGTAQGGVSRFDRQSRRFTRFVHDPDNKKSLSDNSVRSMYGDRSGTLWFGTHSGGLSQWGGSQRKFSHFTPDEATSNSISHRWVRSFLETRDGLVLVGTTAPVLDILDPKTRTFSHRQMRGSVSAFHEEPDGTIWIGTTEGLVRYARRSGRTTFYRHSPRNPESLGDDNVRVLGEDRHGNLWVGYYQKGVSRFERSTGSFEHFQHDPADPWSLGGDVVKAIYTDHGGNLWIGTYGGLSRYDEERNRFVTFNHDPEDPKSLANNNVLSIVDLPSDSGKVLWVGTIGGGLNRLDVRSGRFTSFTYSNGLPNNVVYGLLADPNGYLWLSTNKGVSRFDPAKRVFKNFDESDGLQSNEFNTGSYHRGPSGMMYFGGVNGFNMFHPDSIRDNPYIPPVVITAVWAFDKLVTDQIQEDGRIELTYEDKYITFEFASLDYHNPSRNRYAFSMKGFDDKWTFSGTRRFATFTNLDPGEYTFRVNGTNHDGVWNTKGASLQIIITPPFWQTWWFIALAIVTVLVASFLIYRKRVDLRLEKARILNELKAAHDVQMGLMPRQDPVVKGLDISGLCLPAHEVGGDFYDFVWLDKKHTRLGVALADVSGKAMNAAMTAVMTSGMVNREIENNQPANKILGNINKAMYLKTDRQVFTAMLFAVIDVPRKILTLSNAGQSLPILRRNGKIQYLKVKGYRFPLGARESTRYTETRVKLRKGDTLLFYTDGLPEARSERDEQFDFERIEKIVQALPQSLSAADMVQTLVQQVGEFSGSANRQDDMTVVIAKVL